MKLERGVAAIITVLSLIAMLCFCMIALGHAETTKARPNSLGVPQYIINPYTYLLGLPVDGQILEGKYTNIRFWPYGTPSLFDQSVLFCGDVASQFTKTGPVVVTYRTQASQMYKGIACHDLKSVFEVK
jgi:hypothetical protein